MSTVTPTSNLSTLPSLEQLQEASTLLMVFDPHLHPKKVAQIIKDRDEAQQAVATLKTSLQAAQEKLDSVHVWDTDLLDFKEVRLSFDEVWAMGEAREKYRHGLTKAQLAEVTKQRDALFLTLTYAKEGLAGTAFVVDSITKTLAEIPPEVVQAIFAQEGADHANDIRNVLVTEGKSDAL